MIDRGQRLLLRRRAGVDDVRRLLLAFVLARIEQQRIVPRQPRQHGFARGRSQAAEYRRDIELAEQGLGLSGIGLRVGARIHDRGFDRTTEQAAGLTGDSAPDHTLTDVADLLRHLTPSLTPSQD